MTRISVYTVVLLALAAPMKAFETPAALETQLQATSVGQIVSLGFTTNGAITLFNTVSRPLIRGGGTLFYSDDPETVRTEGVLYDDTLPAGLQRLYLYHVNGLTTQRRFSVVLTNNSTTTANVQMLRKSFPTPSGNYIAIGREGVRQFYQGSPLPPDIQIPAGQSALLDASLDSRLVSNNQLVAAIYDYQSNVPLRVRAVMIGTGVDTLAAIGTLPVSPDDGRNREGTFPATRSRNANPYVYTTSTGMARLRLAEGTMGVSDPPLAGYDAEDGSYRELIGNYGLAYELTFTMTSNDGRAVAILLNPRGGAYGGWFRTTVTGGATTESFVPTSPATVGSSGQGAVIALLRPMHSATTVLIETMPAGASSLPFEILITPYRLPGPGDLWMLR